MKKIFLLLMLFIGLNLTVNAQDKPVSFGIKAGIAFPNMDYHILESSLGGDTKTSFYIGALANINVSSVFSVQPGLIYMNKGTKYDVNSTDENGFNGIIEEGSFDLSYVELPVNMLANFSVGTSKFFVGTGPYVAYVLSGSRKLGDFKEDLKLGSNEGIFKRMDFGLNFLAGYQLKSGLNIHASYGLGLDDISESSNVKIKNRVFSVGLGFNF